jgi:zinc D-Ala-D-Ala dipeptidase
MMSSISLQIYRNGEELNMGCSYLEFESDRLHVFCDGLSEEQRNNRMLLRKVMMESGFAPFNGEWWHFSYGDKEWAAFWNKPHALFDVIEHLVILK